MSAKQHIMHIYRINTEEIPCCPAVFNNTQCLGDDEIVDVLLFGTPKSFQQEMDRQGIDPMSKTPTELVQFMEHIEMFEDFDGDKKVAAVAKKGNSKKKANGKGSSGAEGSKHCVLDGNNNTHDTSGCKTLMAQAKKLKGNNGTNQKGKGSNKSWKNKAKEMTDDSKKELATLVKKAMQLMKQGELTAVEPLKKRKVKWPSKEEEELCALNAGLKGFNYEDLDKTDLKGESDEEKEDGEFDISMSDEISDEVTVWMAGRIRKEAWTLL